MPSQNIVAPTKSFTLNPSFTSAVPPFKLSPYFVSGAYEILEDLTKHLEHKYRTGALRIKFDGTQKMGKSLSAFFTLTEDMKGFWGLRKKEIFKIRFSAHDQRQNPKAYQPHSSTQRYVMQPVEIRVCLFPKGSFQFYHASHINEMEAPFYGSKAVIVEALGCEVAEAFSQGALKFARSTKPSCRSQTKWLLNKAKRMAQKPLPAYQIS